MTTLTDPTDRAVGAPGPPTPTPSQQSFAELGVDPAIVAALEEQGIHAPFAIQAMTVADALAGRDVCGKAKTGSGKTLAFGVPLLQRTMAPPATEPGRPKALVLVPTRELAVQVQRGLRARWPRPPDCGSSPSTAVPTSSARSRSCAAAST